MGKAPEKEVLNLVNVKVVMVEETVK